MLNNSVSFSLLLNFKMTNVKSNWISCLLDSHTLFSESISFHPQGKVRAAACVCVSDGLHRPPDGDGVGGGWSQAQALLSKHWHLQGWVLHTQTSPHLPPPWHFFFLLSIAFCLPCLLREVCIYPPWGSSRCLFPVPTKVQSRQPTLSLVSFRKSTTINNFKLADKEGTPILKPFFTNLILLLKQ